MIPSGVAKAISLFLLVKTLFPLDDPKRSVRSSPRIPLLDSQGKTASFCWDCQACEVWSSRWPSFVRWVPWPVQAAELVNERRSLKVLWETGPPWPSPQRRVNSFLLGRACAGSQKSATGECPNYTFPQKTRQIGDSRARHPKPWPSSPCLVIILTFPLPRTIYHI